MDEMGTAKVLIVDDEPKSLYALEMLLYSEPYEVLFADCGQGALVQAVTHAPDVILLDVMMPDMSGYEVAERLRADARTAHIPILLATALGRKEDLIAGLNAGADDFLTKPVHGPELRARIRTLLRVKQQYDALQDIMKLREDMADMIVHDMRSPIAALSLFIDLLQRLDDLPPEAERLTEKIRGQALRLNAFLGDLLLLAKMDAGRLVLNRTSVDLAELLYIAAKPYREIAASRRITLALDLPAEPADKHLDARLMQRVIDNLLSNAVKHSPAGGTVTLSLSAPPDSANRLRIQVSDEGPGIPPAFQERIFDRFEVVDAKRTDVPQVGLGLALCKMVVDAHDGRISVINQIPTGALFTIEL